MYHKQVSESESNLKSIMFAIAVFIFVNFSGLVLQGLAEMVHSTLINLNPQLDLPTPDFYNNILQGSLLNLLFSPSDLLQILSDLWNLSNAIISQSWSRDINILISLLSFINTILSFFLKNKYVSIAFSFSLAIGHFTVILPFMEYLISLITYMFDVPIYNFTY